MNAKAISSLASRVNNFSHAGKGRIGGARTVLYMGQRSGLCEMGPTVPG